MSYRLLVVALIAACSDTASGIEVIPGTIDVAEGDEAVAQLRFDGQAEGMFDFEMNEQATTRLDVRIEGTSLIVVPRCSAVAEGRERVSEEITIIMTDRETPPVIVPVNIESNEVGNCAVQISGWPDACPPDDAMTDAPNEIVLAEPSQVMCVRVHVPDSFPSVTVKFPSAIDVDPLFLVAEPVPPPPGEPTAPAPFVVDSNTTATRLVRLNRIENFRGHKPFAMKWNANDTPANGVAHLDLVAGEPGQGALRTRGIPPNVEEYSRVKFIFSNTYYDTPGTGSCVRAMPQDPSTTSLVVVDAQRVAPQGALVCGEALHSLELVTGIGSAGHESVDIELWQCSGCGDDPQGACCDTTGTLAMLDTATVGIDSLSVAETISSEDVDVRACLDIDGDEIPELVISNESSGQILVGTGESDNIRYSTSPVAFPLPTSMFALQWLGEEGVTPVLVGEFSNAPFLRAATKTGWETKQWAVLPTSPYGTEEWVPLAPTHGAGASYLIVQKSSSTLGFACVSKGCTSDGPTINVSAIGGSASPGEVRGIGVADTDGDGDLDLLVAVDGIPPLSGQRNLTLYEYDVRWSGHQIIGVLGGPTLFMTTPTQILWGTLKFVSVEIPGDEDRVFVLARTPDRLFHALVETAPCGNGCRGSQLVGTIGTPFDIANVSEALHIATDLGIWELVDQTWVQRDPERALGQSTFPVPGEETYGRTFRSCLMKPGGRPSFLFDVESGARWSFADVVVETLPAH